MVAIQIQEMEQVCHFWVLWDDDAYILANENFLFERNLCVLITFSVCSFFNSCLLNYRFPFGYAGQLHAIKGQGMFRC